MVSVAHTFLYHQEYCNATKFNIYKLVVPLIITQDCLRYIM